MQEKAADSRNRRERNRFGAILSALLVLLGLSGAAWAVFEPATSWLQERRCQADIDDRRFPEAVTSCSRAFETGGSGRAAASVAMAHLALGERVEAWRWAHLPESRNEIRAMRIRGVVLKARGQIDLARDDLTNALKGALEQGEPAEAARAAHALAGIQWEEGHYSEAFETLHVSEVEASRAKDGPALAMTQLARADIFRALGDAQRADDAFRRAIEAAAPWPSDQAYAFLKFGLAALDRGAPGQARAHLERSLALAEATQNAALGIAARINLAEVLTVAGEYERATALLDGLPAGDQAAWDVLEVRAHLAVARGEFDAAIGLFETIEREPLELDDRWHVLTEKGKTLARAGRKEAAIDAWFAAIAAVEAISRREPEHQGWVVLRRREPFDMLFALLVERGEAARALGVLERYARCEALSLSADGMVSGDPLQRVKAAELLRAEWRERASDLGTIENSTDGVLQPEGRDLLVLHEAAGRLWLGRHRAGGWHFVDASREAGLEPLLHRFLGDSGDNEAAQRLGAALWRAAGLQRSERPLFILSTGRLRRLAFAALRAEGQYWMRLRPIARLASLREQAIRPAVRFGEAPLVAGDPRGDLAAAREEAKWVSGHLSAQPLLGQAVTREAVLSARGRSVLHLATHASLELEGTRLQLADGELTAQQILRHRPSARLVVLASCASGVGRDAAGSDSLATAFLRAGSHAVLATLRSVPDDAAQMLVRAFYEEGGARDPIGALSRAQSRMMGTLTPSIWSSFVVSVGLSYVP